MRTATYLFLLIVASAAPAGTPVPRGVGSYELVEGLVVDRLPAPRGDEPVTMVRIDTEHFEIGLFTAQRHEGRRRPEHWIEEFDLVGVINASMFQPNGHSTALMLDDDVVNNDYVHPAYEGFLAFGERDQALPAVQIVGSDCEGFNLELLKSSYRFVVQDYRLLGCDSRAIEWRDPRQYSVCAVALDEAGRLVWIHSGAPYPISELADWLARGELGLSAALFAEGGAEAALCVEIAGKSVREMGRHGASPPALRFRPVPNVLGIRQISATR